MLNRSISSFIATLAVIFGLLVHPVPAQRSDRQIGAGNNGNGFAKRPSDVERPAVTDTLYVLAASQGGTGLDGFHIIGPTTSNNVPSETAAYSGNHGSANSTASYGGVSVSVHSNSDAATLGGNYFARAKSQDTITIDSPGLTGQSGVARLTYHLNGSFTLVNTGNSAASSWLLTAPSGTQYGGSGPVGNYSSFTDDIGFTFGSPFQIEVGLEGTAKTDHSANATADIILSLSSGPIQVLYNNNPVDYTATRTSGSAMTMSVPSGGSYSTFSVTNGAPFGNGSIRDWQRKEMAHP